MVPRPYQPCKIEGFCRPDAYRAGTKVSQGHPRGQFEFCGLLDLHAWSLSISSKNMSPQNCTFVGFFGCGETGKVGERFLGLFSCSGTTAICIGFLSAGSDAGILLRSIPAKETLLTRGDSTEATPCGKGVMLVAVAVERSNVTGLLCGSFSSWGPDGEECFQHPFPLMTGEQITRNLVFPTADPVTKLFD